MPIIKKIQALVILTSVCLYSAYSQDAGEAFDFSLSPLLGFLYGRGEEIVYKFPETDLYYSRLFWDIKPLFYGGIKADFGPKYPERKHGLKAALTLKFGLPLKVGSMDDWDWLNMALNRPTHFSSHEADSDAAISADLSAGYTTRLTNSLTLNAFVEFSCMRFSWSASNGYTQYPPPDPSESYLPWDENYEKHYLNGKVIKYSQNWLSFSPGVSLKWDISRLCSIEGIFNYTPLVFCMARDDHLQRNRTYFDRLAFGHCIKGGGELTFLPLDKTSVVVFISYNLITGIRGNTYSDNIRYDNIAGAGHSSFDMGIAFKFRLANSLH